MLKLPLLLLSGFGGGVGGACRIGAEAASSSSTLGAVLRGGVSVSIGLRHAYADAVLGGGVGGGGGVMETSGS
jgi:hypothetical protein